MGPAVESKAETKARKLLDYAERQRASGKVESATRWARWVISNYGRTTVATESKLILEEWKSSEPFRTWKDVTGKFKIVAKFLRLDTGNVYLLTETTKEISVAIKRLSRVDQDYVIAREGL